MSLHNTYERAILVAAISDLRTPHHLVSEIEHAAAVTRARLVIVICSHHFDAGVSRTENWDDVQRILTFVYVQATRTTQKMDKVLMDVDVLLRGLDEPLSDHLCDRMDAAFQVDDPNAPSVLELPESMKSLFHGTPLKGQEASLHIPSNSTPSAKSRREALPPLYPVVAVGGTFDHLHAGHKILLSMSAWIASEKIIVGVTDDALLQRKSHKELLEPLSERTARVRGFLALFKPGLIYDVVPITDVYGPTASDPNIQALVVSKETLSGADSIAKLRAEKSLPPLTPFVIDVISADSTDLAHEDVALLQKTKMSSTWIRQWISKQQG